MPGRRSQAGGPPLFPQFSFTTTGSCFNHLKRLLAGPRFRPRTSNMQVAYVDPWPEEPLYIEALADLVRAARAGSARTTRVRSTCCTAPIRSLPAT